MRFLYTTSALALATGLLLTACGGGGSDTTPQASVTSVKVMGDSLADVGTFGIKFTVQGASSLIYPEHVARSYGVQPLCSYFVFNGTTFIANPAPGCTDFAIGGGVVNAASSSLAAADPRGIGVQLQAAAALGKYGPGDLLLIDGGGNDAAALIGAYLATASGSASAVQAYAGLLGSVLAADVVGTHLAAGPGGFAQVGGLYMAALGERFHGLIKTHALDNGAPRVAVLNLVDVTVTPRLQMVLDSIAAAQGGGSAGAAARAQAQGLFRSWIEAFNAALAQRMAGDARVALVDFYTASRDQAADPAQYQLSNVQTPACPITGLGADGLPSYTFATCTDAALSAAPPAGAAGGGWWQRYAFSDSFHPTPYAHQLLAQLISRALSRAGWL